MAMTVIFALIADLALALKVTKLNELGAAWVCPIDQSWTIALNGGFCNVPGHAATAGHVIIDIGMRMLTPRELFRAQGFDDDYVIDTAWIKDRETGEVREVKLTKEQQIRMCGNSVCPPVLEALVRANVPELIVQDRPPKWRPTFAEYQERRAA